MKSAVRFEGFARCRTDGVPASFDRHDLASVDGNRQHQAGFGYASVQFDGARSTVTGETADARPFGAQIPDNLD